MASGRTPAGPKLSRRSACAGLLAASCAGRAAALTVASPPHSPWHALEARSGGRLGVAIRDVKHGVLLGEARGAETFAFCSSFKLSLAAMVLLGAETGEWRLDEELAYSRTDLLANSPVTAAHVDAGRMTMAALAEAAQTASDNAAANLLLARTGGPARLTGFWRALGAHATRLDDNEPALNRVPAGSRRNTTTPGDMARVLDRLLSPDGVLGAESRATLKGWMRATRTGAKRLRAGLPEAWWAGDKTGTGLPGDIPGTYVDIAWVEPAPDRPFAVTAFFQPARPNENIDPAAEAVLAEVGRMAAAVIRARLGKGGAA